jgi:aspartate 1-decarboxylase
VPTIKKQEIKQKIHSTFARTMNIQVLKSKIHRAKITQAELHYVGSITLDLDLMEAANMIEGEKVHVLNVANGDRLETYVITGKRGSGEVCINGPAARRMSVGDLVIVVSYASMDFETAKTFKPWVIFPDANNRIIKE